MAKIRFTAETIRSGQPRAYADKEAEHIVTVERLIEEWMCRGSSSDMKAGEWRPWLYPVADNAAGQKWFQDWCDRIVKATCQNFYRTVDEPGANWASPILKWMRVDREKGTIHVFITEAYTD